MVLRISNQKFLERWNSIRNNGKQSFMMKNVLFLTVIISPLIFIFDNYGHLDRTDSIGMWLFTIIWYLFASMFISAFVSNLRWKMNERKFHKVKTDIDKKV